MQQATYSVLFALPSPILSRLPYRNFNLCPHCIAAGKEPLLWRYHEGLPMISRSDGVTFHLLLADCPRPYPAERSSGKTHQLSLCFLYEHGSLQGPRATVIVVPDHWPAQLSVYRWIESITDIVAFYLSIHGSLPDIVEIDRLTTNFPQRIVA